MDIISLIVVLAVVGLVLWLVTTYIPMPQPVKTVIMVVVVLLLCVWLLQAFGVSHLTVGRVH